MLLVVGCGQPASRVVAIDNASGAPSMTIAPLAPAFPVCDGDETPPSLATVRALSPATREVRFRLSEPVTEFRVKLLNHFKLPRDGATTIAERTWAEGQCRLTIWSTATDERPVDLLRWREGDEF